MGRCLSAIKRFSDKIRLKRSYPFLVVAILIALELLMARQGLNLYDDGFVLTAYRQIFVSPGSVSYMFLYYWLINIGGVWNALFGSFGIYGFRVLECITIAANMALVWSLLRRAVPKGLILSGFVMTFLMIANVEVFEYNTFSAFASLAVIAFMMKALGGKGRKWMFLAGFLAGLNVFVRLPNVCMSMFILVLLPYFYYTKDGSSTLRLFLSAVAGMLGGVLFTLVFMSAAGHLAYFEDALKVVMALAGNEENSHGLGRMLFTTFYVHAHSAVLLILSLLCPAFALLLIARLRNRRCAVLCCVLLFAVHLVVLYRFVDRLLFLLNSAALVSCLYVSYVRRDEPRVVYLSSLAFLMNVLLPLGSDGGIVTIGVHSLWLAMPFIPYAAFLVLQKFTGVRRKTVLAFVVLSFCFIAFKALNRIKGPAYYEHGTRFDNVSRVNHPLANVLTDKKTAASLSDFLSAMSTEISEGDTVFFINSPMLHYLTGTRPYLDNPWPGIFGRDYYVKQLARARAASSCLPVVAYKRDDYELRDDDNISELVEAFLSENGYVEAYKNDNYIMFVPTRK